MNEEITLNTEKVNSLREENEVFGKEKNSPVRNFLKALRPGKYLNQKNFTSALPFILFLGAIAFIYIGNTYYAENTMREIDHASNELKELRSEYIATKSDLMLMSKQSEVAKNVEATGIKESVVPPKKITIKAKP